MPREFTAEVETVSLRSVPTGITDIVRRRYEEEFGAHPGEGGGWYRPDDWARISHVYRRLRKGGAFIDIGLGAGQFLNLVASRGRFTSVHGSDPTTFTKYREFFDGIVRLNHSVADLAWPDDSFDVVTCMEVLEHVTEDVFTTGLAELRRVCRAQLIVSVPFEEPEPLSAGHVRRFTEKDIVTLFPEGSYTLLDRPRMPWMLIEERPNDPGWPAARHEEDSGDNERIRGLEATVAALRSRRALRLADAAGSKARSLRRRALSVIGR